MLKDLNTEKDWISGWNTLDQHRQNIDLYREMEELGESVDSEIDAEVRLLIA